MTREQLEARLAQLRKEIEQAYANVNAYQGAIQDCEFWLAQMDAEDNKAIVERLPESES